ncbi:hypothetical protein VPH35_108071 [Triticum aestivum]
MESGYHPIQRKTNCSRWCGEIYVPFPFGLEGDCSARMSFQLNCTNLSMSALQFPHEYGTGTYVKYIDITEGLMNVTYNLYDEGYFAVRVPKDGILYIGTEVVIRQQWVVANLTCHEALENRTGYACVSMNSICLGVNSKWEYVGYRCKCVAGFDENPYIVNGCKDVDECKTPGTCNGICHNTEGSHYCTKCPRNTVYDTTIKMCIATGIGVGFGVLLLISILTLFARRWEKDIKKKLRRKHFRQNQGPLLEQLISSDENASDNTKIFSLLELEKATNNFDPTRIVGRGGHGMVYKGILSDQRVVAIKKSKVIEQVEISQFINEVAVLSQADHRNIVKLFGCCLETEVPLLVYDFIPNGSLFEILHASTTGISILSWDDCLKIAAEAAGALYYLHSAASVSIFHRDVKSTNILLDGNYTAKVSDFGASRLVPIDQTHIVTNIQGTFGYLDPEYYLAETCLRLRGEERPTMKQVEMKLQYVRSKRLRACQVAVTNEYMQPFLSGQSQDTLPMFTTPSGIVDRVNIAAQRNQNCYSLEQEFMASATLPR